MKFLCLHGSYGSAANFQIQLAPFVQEVEKSTPGRFRWIDGFHQADPPKGFTEYFGPSPLYKFVGYDGAEALNGFAEKLRDFPVASAPEDTIRHLFKDEEIYTGDAVRNMIDQLLKVINSDPEIEGILGYSEGAMAAATLILEERRRWEENGTPRRIKQQCGVFFAGWPPVYLMGDKVKPLLADECENIIDIPTCHIVGCKDPYIHGAMALYDMCDKDSAELFDHGKGHTLPRDGRTIGELTSTFHTAMTKSVPV
ncbi:serine hydrolase (FSH1) domain-containing protein [Hirsutella rhossiliensis]|uniref:Serine hydrolase (FSH1) domain-containing protein n=1 Tax=Hirsutella rhossiliensis TaxID=111463 RepID=A0A9P8MV32_9HYPO|nr:serine hydrolase (FSH1) domain-containing protein [Hirsutella rhossiliensis]KAH0961689.1 serine hydrolase (FSH1) domain-containing protein [Hirsutella rhossiliensis]